MQTGDNVSILAHCATLTKVPSPQRDDYYPVTQTWVNDVDGSGLTPFTIGLDMRWGLSITWLATEAYMEVFESKLSDAHEAMAHASNRNPGKYLNVVVPFCGDCHCTASTPLLGVFGHRLFHGSWADIFPGHVAVYDEAGCVVKERDSPYRHSVDAYEPALGLTVECNFKGHSFFAKAPLFVSLWISALGQCCAVVALSALRWWHVHDHSVVADISQRVLREEAAISLATRSERSAEQARTEKLFLACFLEGTK